MAWHGIIGWTPGSTGGGLLSAGSFDDPVEPRRYYVHTDREGQGFRQPQPPDGTQQNKGEGRGEMEGQQSR
ncbi:hypothetical protein VTO42DRAFT_2366 [Malbranchea cinnamomea]